MRENNSFIISIIIPVYNLEREIKKTLCPILENITDDIELIIVDDGSVDSSLNVIMNVCGKRDNIIIISQDNGGVSSARNTGLSKARGKYVTFVDGDDLIDISALIKNYDLIRNNYELIIFGYETISNDKVEKYVYDEFIGSNIEELIDFSITYGRLNTCWGKLFSLECINKYDCRFPTNIKIGEDQVFVFKFLNCINSYTISPDILYRYIIRENSAMSSIHDSRIMDAMNVFEEIYKIYDKNNWIKSSFETVCFTLYLYGQNYKKSDMFRILSLIPEKYITILKTNKFTVSKISQQIVYVLLTKKKFKMLSAFLQLRGFVRNIVKVR